MSEYIENVVSQTSKLDWAFPFQRTGKWPLDRTELFSSFDDAVLYAKGDGSDERALGGASYVGQSISVFDTEKNTVTRYVIDIDRSLKPIGSAPIGDNLSIEIVDGKIQLKNFSKNYYKFIPAVKNEETGEIISESKFQLTEGFVEGLEPRVIVNSDQEYEIAWYEPFPETIESITDKVDSIQDSLDILEGDASVEGSIDNKIASAVTNAAHLKREIFVTLDEAEAKMQEYVLAGTAEQYIYMVARDNKIDGNHYDEYMAFQVADIWVLDRVGDWTIDLSGYATKEELNNKVDKQEGHRLITPAEQEKLASLVIGDDGGVEISGKVNASNVQELYDAVTDIVTGTGQGIYDDIARDKLGIEAGAEKNVINSVSDEFTIDENRNLTVKKINGIKIEGLASNTEFATLKNSVDANTESLKTFGIRLDTVETKFNDYVLKSTYETDIGEIRDILTWKDMDIV